MWISEVKPSRRLSRNEVVWLVATFVGIVLTMLTLAWFSFSSIGLENLIGVSKPLHSHLETVAIMVFWVTVARLLCGRLIQR